MDSMALTAPNTVLHPVVGPCADSLLTVADNTGKFRKDGLIFPQISMTSHVHSMLAVFSSMREAEQYFSADRFTARSTCRSLRSLPQTLK